jgi:hypothetical protein
MPELNRLFATLVLLIVIGGVGGSLGGVVATHQVTACAASAEACQ